jgi:hypothetical protein
VAHFRILFRWNFTRNPSGIRKACKWVTSRRLLFASGLKTWNLAFSISPTHLHQTCLSCLVSKPQPTHKHALRAEAQATRIRFCSTHFQTQHLCVAMTSVGSLSRCVFNLNEHRSGQLSKHPLQSTFTVFRTIARELKREPSFTCQYWFLALVKSHETTEWNQSST